MAQPRLLGVGIGWVVFWAIVLGFSVLFVSETLEYTLLAESDPSADPLTSRQALVYTHAAMAIPILFLAPLQFHPGFRTRFPKVHRWTGRLFLTASILAACLALYLALEYKPTASRPALFVFGLLWIFFASAAWFSAMRRDFLAHRAFMIRAVAVGFAFVWVRMMRVTQDYVLPFIEDAEMRLVAREYLCFIIPLLAVEIWLTYWPALKKVVKRKG